MSNNGIPPLNDWQEDNYPVIYDEGAATLQYVKTGVKNDINTGGSSYLSLDPIDSQDVNIPQDKYVAFNGVPVVGGINAGQIPNFTIEDDEDDMWIGTEFYNAAGLYSDWFYDVAGSDMIFSTLGVVEGRCKVSQSEVYLFKDDGFGGQTKFEVTGAGLKVESLTGATGTFISQDGKTITVTKGLITDIT